LTDAANRRHFVRRVLAEISRQQRQDLALSVLAMDPDHFKSINDRYSHPGRDETLKNFVAGIKGGL